MNFLNTLNNLCKPLTQRLRNTKAYKFTKRASLAMIAPFLIILSFIFKTVNKKDRLRSTMIKTVEKISELKIPKFLRSKLFRAYSKFYKVKLEDLVEPLDSFKTFGEFFTRRVRPRFIDESPTKLISPADSKILKIAQITEDTCQIIKGASYSLKELLTGIQEKYTKEEIESLKKNERSKLYQVVFYLAPGDYHRFHYPTDMEVDEKKKIDGLYLSVNEKTLIKRKKVYEKNARVCVNGSWSEGFMSLVLVGALNVGRIIINEGWRNHKGGEMGYFNLGSTVVMIFEAKEIKQWMVKEGDKVSFSQNICEVCQ